MSDRSVRPANESVAETSEGGHEILLAVAGSVAAYKAADLCSQLVQGGHRVTAVLTRSAERFIGVTTFEALTGRPVYTSQWLAREHYRGEHIGLAARAEVYLVAPCSADLLGKFAGGLADDLASLLALTIECPMLVAPAMNRAMWQKPAVQRNVAQLRDDGVQFIGPEEGWQSCRAVGIGRMAEPTAIVEALVARLAEERQSSR